MVDIIIDSLTDCLVENATGNEYDTSYYLVQKTITKAEALELNEIGWNFDWSQPHRDGYDVYQLFVDGDDDVQGMIAIKHIREQLYTHVSIVENAPFNIGSNGVYRGVGAHLFAIACKLSWEAGNEGYVQFTAKSNLIQHYIETVNAQLIDGQNMYIDSYGALNLIKKYFKE